MKVPKLSFEDALGDVVIADRCMGCSACVSVCPVNCLEYSEGKPRLVKVCNNCGICAAVCPRYEFSWPALEDFVFEREKKPEEAFGIYRRIVLAQASDKNILQACQDGGAVTALLAFALEERIIDGAALSGISPNKPFYPVPKLVTTPREVLSCAGTRYSYSPNLLAFQEGVNQKKQHLAFVGTPCQIHSMRKIEMVPLKKYTNPLQFTIGLMCTECFSYEGLMEKHIQGELGVNLHDIKNINIKAKLLITTKSGEVKIIPLKDAKQYTRPSCTICPDFSAELADISTGGLGLNGWTFTILRTEKGEKLFERAEKEEVLRTRPVEEEQGAFDLLVKLSQRKRTLSHASQQK